MVAVQLCRKLGMSDCGDSTPLDEDKQARRFWKGAVLAFIMNAVLGVGSYILDSHYPFGPLQLLYIWFPLYLTATLPYLIEKSARPFVTSLPRYVNDAIVIRGNHKSLARVITGYLLWIFTAGTIVAGFWTGQPLHASLYAAGVGFMAYLEGTRSPISDLSIALRDRQTIVLTPAGIHLHFPPPISIEDPERETEVDVLWKDNVYIDYIIGSDIYFLGDMTHPGPWIICSQHIGITYTGLDTLMRHFNDHPQDRPLLATPNGLNLVNQILTKAHKTITNPTNK